MDMHLRGTTVSALTAPLLLLTTAAVLGVRLRIFCILGGFRTGAFPY
jgi:hypothetical protein